MVRVVYSCIFKGCNVWSGVYLCGLMAEIRARSGVRGSGDRVDAPPPQLCNALVHTRL
jgi:hypothetical protein